VVNRPASRAYVLGLCVVLVACDRQTPAPPTVTPSPAGETINGSERIGWDQRAADSVELAAVRYAIYVDNARSELAGASCAASQTPGTFTCSARLPTLSSGAHTLELASFVVDGSVLESARSGALRVTVVAAAVTSSSGAITATDGERPTRPAADWRNTIVTTSAGAQLRLEGVADGVRDATDLAFAPDGRLFVAERDGRIRIISRNHADADRFAAGNRLLAIAVDPQFERTHFVYVVTVGASRAGGAMFTLARFREAANTFGDRVVLLDEIRAAPLNPAASLRFGPDGKLYAAFDDGGDAVAINDMASPNGKVLRLNTDGSTPADQAGGTPVYAHGYHSPRGLAWQPDSGTLWVAERSAVLEAVMRDRSAADGGTRGVTRQRLAVSGSTEPSAIAFYRHDLLIASDAGRGLLRVRFDPHDLTTVATEVLLGDDIGPVRLVASGPEDAIYIATDRAIARLVPVNRSR